MLFLISFKCFPVYFLISFSFFWAKNVVGSMTGNYTMGKLATKSLRWMELRANPNLKQLVDLDGCLIAYGKSLFYYNWLIFIDSTHRKYH